MLKRKKNKAEHFELKNPQPRTKIKINNKNTNYSSGKSYKVNLMFENLLCNISKILSAFNQLIIIDVINEKIQISE